MTSVARDEKERKKKRLIKTETSTPEVKKSKETVALFYAEEAEVDKRDPETDLTLFQGACGVVREAVNDIQKMKTHGKTNKSELEEKRADAVIQFVTLKKINRLSHFRCRKVRDSTNEAKQRIDKYHLQLQNLLYEAMHLQKEINKCLEFKSKDEEIDLVPVEEFYKEAPKQISKPETTKKDEHQLTLARLDWELEQRQRLSKKLKEVSSSKDEILKEIDTKQEYLDSLQPKLNSILQATKPVQTYLKMPYDETKEQHSTALHLPHPLYVLYMQSSAYKDACDKNLKVTIDGDIHSAKTLDMSVQEIEEDSDSDNEEHEKKTIAEEKLYEHWKQNNPDLRKVESELQQEDVINKWSDQIVEQEEKLLSARLEEKEFERLQEEKRQAALEEERKKEMKRLQDQKKLKQVLEDQMRELRQRESESERIKNEQESLELEQWNLEKLEESRRLKEEQRKKQDFGLKKIAFVTKKKETTEDRLSDKKQRVFRKHPLTVAMEILCKEGSELLLTFSYNLQLHITALFIIIITEGSKLLLTFSYLLQLEIITVHVKVLPSLESVHSSISGSDLLSPDSILNEIYTGDHGNNTPNPANQYELRRMGLHDFSEYVNQVGRPYQWTQWLGGLQFLGDGNPVTVKSTVSSGYMQQTVKQLRKRLKARLALLHQMASLERNTIPVSSNLIDMFPAKISSRLISWKRSTYEDFCSLDYTRNIIEGSLVSETDIYFVATMERGSAKLISQVVVAADYPTVPPMFVVSISWQTDRNATTDVHIQELEEEVNVHYTELIKDKSKDNLLSNQLQRLLMCFDIYLETETQDLSAPIEIPKEKVFTRLARGPNRKKPYKYIPDLGIFTHR
ncbi:hypothetical protein LOTGIDRAFT_236170 [Lottia gigantea]|uniref:Uncharacterized protein n=1 Tax=Lottia gigantea TaxID=225164 RepID=V4B7Q0_LOTGI|nr:hypothetical protein LOTGIDRAFT_236170 [Lottia gigantea]ESO84659.1 hypothetical protein LOTGIDRAFT_236170 [Lottia gigantea]